MNSITCSVCDDEVVLDHEGERSTTRLQCGHQFHLDCICHAFAAKGVMQCPNCRHTEIDRWLGDHLSRSSPIDIETDFHNLENNDEDRTEERSQPTTYRSNLVFSPTALSTYILPTINWATFQNSPTPFTTRYQIYSYHQITIRDPGISVTPNSAIGLPVSSSNVAFNEVLLNHGGGDYRQEHQGITAPILIGAPARLDGDLAGSSEAPHLARHHLILDGAAANVHAIPTRLQRVRGQFREPHRHSLDSAAPFMGATRVPPEGEYGPIRTTYRHSLESADINLDARLSGFQGDTLAREHYRLTRDSDVPFISTMAHPEGEQGLARQPHAHSGAIQLNRVGIAAGPTNHEGEQGLAGAAPRLRQVNGLDIAATILGAGSINLVGHQGSARAAPRLRQNHVGTAATYLGTGPTNPVGDQGSGSVAPRLRHIYQRAPTHQPY